MDFFQKLSSWVGLQPRPSRPPRPNALELSTLSILPMDIIVHVARFLPAESAASFAMCCRPLYFALDTEYLEDIMRPMQESTRYLGNLRPLGRPAGMRRELFLELLGRDLPDHIICVCCKKLHAINKARGHLHSKSDYSSHLKCWKKDYDSHTSDYIHREFSSTVFEMTMNRYRQGLEYSDLLDLLSLKTTVHNHHDYMEQETAAAKIIDGNLVIREQKVFMVPATQPIPFPRNARVMICNHITFCEIEDLNRYLRSIRVSDWKSQKGAMNGERVVRCLYCRSEYQIDFKQSGTRGNAMYVTKWLDLGQGPSEYDYRSHLYDRGISPSREIRFDAGSICAAFEGRSQFDFDSDTVLNDIRYSGVYEWVFICMCIGCLLIYLWLSDL